MSKRVAASELDQDLEYVALVRLEGRDGFVEPGGVVRLTQASARVLLAAGLVMPGVSGAGGGHAGPPLPPDVDGAEVAEE